MISGFVWLDTGTHDSLSEATTFISVFDETKRVEVVCLEGIAYPLGRIIIEQLGDYARPMLKNDYGKYLLSILDEND